MVQFGILLKFNIYTDYIIVLKLLMSRSVDLAFQDDLILHPKE